MEKTKEILSTKIEPDGTQKLILDLDLLKQELRDENSKEIFFIEDQKEGIRIELHSDKSIDELSSLGIGLFNFVKESRTQQNKTSKMVQ